MHVIYVIYVIFGNKRGIYDHKKYILNELRFLWGLYLTFKILFLNSILLFKAMNLSLVGIEVVYLKKFMLI